MKLSWQVNLVICLWLGWAPSFAEETLGVREYQLKATFLMRFGKFVTYPQEVFSDSSSVFNICVLGDDPFQGALDSLVNGEKVRGRLVKVTYLRDIEKAGDCQTLFVSSSEQKQLSNIFTYLKQRPILTVGDSDIENFVIRGGMIQFYLLDNNVRFFIDPVTASEAKLELSSRLLQIAKIVRKGGKTE
jgi:hypothetical protein